MDTRMLQFLPSRTKKEVDAEIKAIRRACTEACKTREGAIALLVGTGMYTKTGQLKKRFR